MKRFALFIAFFVVSIPLPLWGFNEPQHTDISLAAFDAYMKCHGGQSDRQQELRGAFARGSREEDTRNLVERGLNWHFYNRDGALRNSWLFNRSNSIVFQRRINDLEAAIAKKAPLAELYRAAGAVAHHIQDMSSPAHVMPIYHANGIFGVKDAFDAYVAQPFNQMPQICPAVQCPAREKPEFFMAGLLEGAARHTIGQIEKPVFNSAKNLSGETWLLFWSNDKEGEYGFRKYGPYGNNFGKAMPCRANSCSYTPEIYAAFYKARFMRAVEDSVKVLLYLDCRLR